MATTAALLMRNAAAAPPRVGRARCDHKNTTSAMPMAPAALGGERHVALRDQLAEAAQRQAGSAGDEADELAQRGEQIVVVIEEQHRRLGHATASQALQNYHAPGTKCTQQAPQPSLLARRAI